MIAYLDGCVKVHGGDCMAVVKTLADNSIDAVCTDPPYALTANKKGGSGTASINLESPYGRARIGTGNGEKGFMGKAWDTGDVAFAVEFWREVLRVIKPGGHLVAFGGTRTYHRLACAIEDAGFEIRDQIGWCFGTGFPKSHNVSKGIDRAARAERETIVVGAVVKRMIPGADQNRDGWEKTNGRVYVPTITRAATPEAAEWEGWGTALKPAWEPICLARKPLSEGTVAANVLRWGTGALNIDACRVAFTGDADKSAWKYGAAGKENKSEDSWKNTSKVIIQNDASGRWPANIIHDGSEEVIAAFPDSEGAQGVVGGGEPSETGDNGIYGRFARVASAPTRNDSGSAARFFYSAKADSDDRLGSKHPTVKPLDLMQWLCRLITPPGGTILDPFAGTGTTGEAAWREKFSAILVERETEYLVDIERRMAYATAGQMARKVAIAKVRGKEDDGPLFRTPVAKGAT